jgi:hypothetical protein
MKFPILVALALTLVGCAATAPAGSTPVTSTAASASPAAADEPASGAPETRKSGQRGG